MVPPGNSKRATKKFVQWKEPMKTRGQSTTLDGDASTSTGRKNKHPRRVRILEGQAVASIQAAEVEVCRDVTTASAAHSQRGGAPTSVSAPQEPSTTPPPRFRPPKQVGTSSGSNVELQRSSIPERVPEQLIDMLPQRVKQRLPPTDVVQDLRQSRSVLGDGLSQQHTRTTTTGKACMTVT